MVSGCKYILTYCSRHDGDINAAMINSHAKALSSTTIVTINLSHHGEDIQPHFGSSETRTVSDAQVKIIHTTIMLFCAQLMYEIM